MGSAMSLTNTLVCRNALSSFDCSHKRQNQNKLKNSARRGPHRKQKKRQRVNKRCGGHTYPKCTSCQDLCTAENRLPKSFIDWHSVYFFFLRAPSHPVLLPPCERHFKLVCVCVCLPACLAFSSFSLLSLYMFIHMYVQCVAMSIYLYLYLNLPLCCCLPPCAWPGGFPVCSFTLSLSRHRFSLDRKSKSSSSNSSQSRHRAPFPQLHQFVPPQATVAGKKIAMD